MAWILTDGAFLRNEQNMPEGAPQKLAGKSAMNRHEVFTVLSRLRHFKDQGHFCDFYIHVNSMKFSVHKVVLAGWSPRLASVLLSQDDQSTEMVLHYDNERAFADCLEYMYSGFISVSESNVIHLLELGRGLLIDSLVNVCETYLQKTVSIQNFVSKFFISLKYDLKVLEEIIADFIETNIASIIEQPEFLNLQPAELRLLLTSEKMRTTKQEVKFSLIISWVGCDITDRDKYMLYLFDLINWTHSVNDLLIQISCTQNIFTTNEFCLFQLLHSLVTALGHHLGPFITTYPRLYAVYSNMIDDLSRPAAFLTASQHHLQLAPLVVSPLINKTACQVQKETTDAAVNTDFEFDLTGFQTDTSKSKCEDTASGSLKEEILKGNIENSLAVESTEVEIADQQQLNAKHRRKSLPRKLPLKGKESKERKRKTKKQSIKETDGKQSSKETDCTQGSEINLTGKAEVSLANVEERENTMDYILGNSSANNEDVQSQINENGTTFDKHEDVDDEDKNSLKVKLRRNPDTGGLKKSKAAKARLKTSQTKKPHQKQNKKLAAIIAKRELRVYCSHENCYFSCKSQNVLDKHVERVHVINVNLECWKCGYTVNQMRDLCSHLKDHFPTPPYQCDFGQCSVKFQRLGLFVRHHMSHLKSKPYTCDACQKAFATYNQLSCHKKLHEARQFECDVCGRKFGTKGVMQQHRAIHFDNKPYLCDLCGFSTKHQSHLISHRKIHTGDVKRCTFPNCSYSTPKSAHMTQHMNSHLNIRNHICQVCGKSFVVRGKLLRHERIHLKDKLYKCKQCEYQTSRTDRMKLHIESHGIKLKKRGKNNMASGYDYDSEPEIDFHQLYDRVLPGEDSGPPTQVLLSSANQSLTYITMTDVTDMKPIDVMSFAASSSMIIDNYNTARLSLDPMGTAAAVASIEGELQSPAEYQQNLTAFDQL